MSFAHGGEDDQGKMVPFNTNTDEEAGSNGSEEENEEEDCEDLGKIDVDVNKSKEIQMKMAECKDVSIGTTTNYIFHLNHTKEAANLALLLRSTSSQSSLSDSSSSNPSQFTSSDSGISTSLGNTPLPSTTGSNNPFYYPPTAQPVMDRHNWRTPGNWLPDSSSVMRALSLDESASGICYSDNSQSNVTRVPLLKAIGAAAVSASEEPHVTRNCACQLSSIRPTTLLKTTDVSSECVDAIPSVNNVRLKPDNSRQNAAGNRTVFSERPVRSTLRRKESNNFKRLPMNFVQLDGYAVSIEPGEFYESRSEKGCYIVEMRNGTEYCIKLTNNTILRCNVDVHVDGKFVAALQMDPGGKQTLEGPLTTEEECGKFIFLRASDAPEEAEINPTSEENGIVMVDFVPELIPLPLNTPFEMQANGPDVTRKKAEISSSSSSFFDFCANALSKVFNREAAIAAGFISGSSGLISGSEDSRRGGGISSRAVKSPGEKSFCSGATALVGRQQQREYTVAEEMQEDRENAVSIILRLVARRTDEPYIPQNNEPIKPLRSTRRPPPFDP